MLHEAPIAVQKPPHVIVVGNEKGGSGKTTIAMHVAVALLKDGQRVGTVDLDSNQKSFTHYIENRRIWAQRRGIELEIPAHRHIPRVERGQLDMNEAEELAAFEAAVDRRTADGDGLHPPWRARISIGWSSATGSRAVGWSMTASTPWP